MRIEIVLLCLTSDRGIKVSTQNQKFSNSKCTKFWKASFKELEISNVGSLSLHFIK